MDPIAGGWGPPRPLAGALSGAVTVLTFVWLHDVFIMDIWFNVGPMLVSGVVCGLALVWGYNAAVTDHSTRRWSAYVGACGALLVVLGAVSLLVLEPRFTVAALSGDDDAFAKLLPPALPLMGGAAVVGSGLLWAWLGRKKGALLPILAGQVLLVFFVGHQFALLGLVEMSTEVLTAFAEFVALTVFLTGTFAVGVRLLDRLRPGDLRRRSPAPRPS